MLRLIESLADKVSHLHCSRHPLTSQLLGAPTVYIRMLHADNVAARRLYHSYGFRAPKGKALSEVSGAKGGAMDIS